MTVAEDRDADIFFSGIAKVTSQYLFLLQVIEVALAPLFLLLLTSVGIAILPGNP